MCGHSGTTGTAGTSRTQRGSRKKENHVRRKKRDERGSPCEPPTSGGYAKETVSDLSALSSFTLPLAANFANENAARTLYPLRLLPSHCAKKGLKNLYSSL